MRTSALFTEPRSAPAKRLAELARRHDELRAEARDLRAREASGAAAMAEAAEALRSSAARHRAFNDSAAEVKSAEQRVSKIEKSQAGLADETKLIADAIAHVEGEINTFAIKHSEQLMAELREDGRAAAERLTAAVREVQEANANYVAAGNRTEALMRVVAPDRLRVLRLPPVPGTLTALAQDPSAAAVPVPVPGAPDCAVLSTAP